MPTWLPVLLRTLQYLPSVIRLVPTVVQAVHDIMGYIHDDCRLPSLGDPGTRKMIVQARLDQFNRAVKEASAGNHRPLAMIHEKAMQRGHDAP